MAKIPASVDTEVIPWFELYRKGKVRNTYRLPHHPELLLSAASDRISIFDFVLPIVVPFKGEVLTALNIFWRKNVLGDLVAHDLVAYGAGIDPYLPDPEYLRGDPELQKRALVIRMLDMLPVEVIVRGYLTGSGLTAYKKDRTICGHIIPEGLDDGAELPYPIFTPTTKAEEGHDEHIDADSVCTEYGFAIERGSLQLYELARRFARDRGIILADTKFECGREKHGELVLCDEVFTPDSSRFWDLKAWKESRTKRSSPPSLDKQYVRNEGKRLGVDKRDPLIPQDVEWVHGLKFSPEVVEITTRIYRYIFWRLTGKKLEAFQKDQMGIGVNMPPVHVHVVLGSESDRGQAQKGLNWLRIDTPPEITAELDIISCHRNPEDLRQFAKTVREDSVIIAGAGKAAALPGVLQTWLNYFGKGHIPVLGVAFDGGTDAANAAARLSIEELPGNPVILAPEGTAYFGSEGFLAACVAAVKDEFFVVPTPIKEAKHNVPLV